MTHFTKADCKQASKLLTDVTNVPVWDRYETDRAYILKLLGYPPFACDAYSHTRWADLPEKIQQQLGGAL